MFISRHSVALRYSSKNDEPSIWEAEQVNSYKLAITQFALWFFEGKQH
jgi:hypothetical protein